MRSVLKKEKKRNKLALKDYLCNFYFDINDTCIRIWGGGKVSGNYHFARALPIINRGNCVRNSGQRVIYGSRNVRERLSEGRSRSLIITSAQLLRRHGNDYRRLEYQRALNTPMYILHDWSRLRAHAYVASPFLRLKSNCDRSRSKGIVDTRDHVWQVAKILLSERAIPRRWNACDSREAVPGNPIRFER